MPRYMVGGYDDYSVLHLVPVSGNHGVELPAELYQRWRQARAELDAAQREHDERSAALEAEQRDLDKRIEVEDRRWESEREKFKDALRRAKE